jgi:ribosomal protein S27E
MNHNVRCRGCEPPLVVFSTPLKKSMHSKLICIYIKLKNYAY